MQIFVQISLILIAFGYGCSKEEGNSMSRLDKPLYLTPYLVKGNINAARDDSRVGIIGGSPDMESYAGFFTVREKLNNQLFFWFFPAIKGHRRAPLVLWLQGGPGESSMRGLLVEHGPLKVSSGGDSCEFRPHTWAHNVSMLYVDQPVGAGFSHTLSDHERGYAKNVADVAADLYQFLGQFFVLFPEYHNNAFFIAGEGYADGVPSLPATLYENMTGLSQVYNVDLTKAPAEFSAYVAFLDRPDVRHALHVGQAAFFKKGAAVQEHMSADVMTSQRHRLTELLDQGVKVLVYTGQKDLRTPFSSLESFMRSLRWKGQLEYNATNRTPWHLTNARVAGYYKVVRNYAEVLVRGAGQVVPFDKPREMFTLVTRFVYGLPIQDTRVDK